MILVYHILSCLILVLALPALPLVWLASKKRRANLLQRLGLFTGFSPKPKGRFRIWVHALSVGEVNSALPFLAALNSRWPGADIVFTASTRTGFETARAHMNRNALNVSSMGYFPFDLWPGVSRVVSRIDPDLVCLVETDLWPGFLSVMKQRSTPVVLVNARLSERSLKGYKRLGPLAALFFRGLSLVMAQTQRDALRFAQVRVPEPRLYVAGNIKFDSPRPQLSGNDVRNLARRLGIRPGQKVWIAGSTHEGEEEILVASFARVRDAFPDLKLVIAPRDPGRTGKLIQVLGRDLTREGFVSACLTDPESKKNKADILFIDTLGELARAYALADIAFIGGSLVPKGGHNPLEPAMFGKPVFFGPHMDDFHEIRDWLVAAEGGFQVKDVRELTRTVSSLLGDDALCCNMGKASLQVFEANAGALDRILAKLGQAYIG